MRSLQNSRSFAGQHATHDDRISADPCPGDRCEHRHLQRGVRRTAAATPIPQSRSARAVRRITEPGAGRAGFAAPELDDWSERIGQLVSVAEFAVNSFTATDDGGAETVRGAVVSGSFFDLLGVRFLLAGRWHRAMKSADPGAQRCAVATSIWRAAGHRRKRADARRSCLHRGRCRAKEFSVSGGRRRAVDAPGLCRSPRSAAMENARLSRVLDVRSSEARRHDDAGGRRHAVGRPLAGGHVSAVQQGRHCRSRATQRTHFRTGPARRSSLLLAAAGVVLLDRCANLMQVCLSYGPPAGRGNSPFERAWREPPATDHNSSSRRARCSPL